MDRTLVKDLADSGFLSISEKLSQIQVSTNHESHQRLAKAVDILRGKRRYNLAERLDMVRAQIFGEATPEEDKAQELRDALHRALEAYAPGCAVDVFDEVVEFAKEVCHQETRKDLDEEGKEREGLGPGFEPGYVRAPQTIPMPQELPPTPVREPT